MTTAVEYDASRYWELRGKIEDHIQQLRDEADTAPLARARQMRVDANDLQNILDSID